MTNQEMVNLEETIRIVTSRIQKYKGRGLGEQNTKASLIEPVLEALGWDIRDPDEVHREFKPTSRDSPVDYALKLMRKARLFVEAKGLDENLSDRKWISQVLGYATVAGVEWCVLSDGDEFRFYNATAALDADEKLFCKLRLTETAECDAASTLRLISRSNMEENLLDVLWDVHFVDRQVREGIRRLIDSPDKRLVKMIRSFAPKLTPKEIADSIRRLDIRIEPPARLPDAAGIATPPVTDRAASESRSEAAKLAWETRRSKLATGIDTARQGASKVKRKKTLSHNSTSLSDVVAAGILKPPLRLFRKYKGTVLEAILARDGSVEFGGAKYSTCSAAAGFARKSIAGRLMSTNGWVFWQFADENGRSRTLEDARRAYVMAKSKNGD